MTGGRAATEPLVIEPGQIWMGQARDHRWRVRILGLSLASIEFEVLGRGARSQSRVRGGHERQFMGRGKFLKNFRLEHDVAP